MRYHFDGYNYIIRLKKGELLVELLDTFAREQELKSVWLSGLGAAQWAELGFYDLPGKHYHWKQFDEPMEVTALQGNLAWRADQPVWHIHGTLGRNDFQAIGGHIKELCVGGTVELHLHTVFDKRLTRQDDEQTGLALLDL